MGKSLFLFSFFTNTNFTEKNVDVCGIRTRIVGVGWRRARLPLNHHHGYHHPLNVFFIVINIKRERERKKERERVSDKYK